MIYTLIYFDDLDLNPPFKAAIPVGNILDRTVSLTPNITTANRKRLDNISHIFVIILLASKL